MSASAPPTPSTMRAWTFSTAGSPSAVLRLNPSLPSPKSPTGAQLLVQISHAALSSAGLNLMRDIPSALRRDAIPELDFSGRVVAVGPAAPPKFAAGTPVFGCMSKRGSVLSGHGTLAEYVLVDSDCVALKPAGMSFEETVGLGCLAQTALAMVRRGGVKKGDRVLVHGGSGGVGMAAVQIVKASGASVVTTCSKAKVDFVRALGVDEVIEYTSVGSLPDHLAKTHGNPPFDVILDTVGSQELYKSSPRFLKSEGSFVNVGTVEAKSQFGSLWLWAKNANLPAALGGVPRKYIMFSAPISGENSETLATLANEGKFRVVVDSVFELADALKAYERSASRDVCGKVIIRIGGLDTKSP